MSVETQYAKLWDAPAVLDNGGQVFHVKHRRFGAVGDWDGTAGTDDIAALEAAIAAAGTGRVVFHGEHRISRSLIVTGAPVLDFTLGTLYPTGDFPALITSASSARRTIIATLSRPVVSVPAAVVHTSVGIEFRSRTHAIGVVRVEGAGSHGIYFHQDSAAANLNFTEGKYSASDCGGDGIRIETTDPGPVDTNGFVIDAIRTTGNARGVVVMSGSGHIIRAQTDAHTGEGFACPAGSTATQMDVTLYDDGTNAVATDLTAGSGIIKGIFNAGIPTTAADSLWRIERQGTTYHRIQGHGVFRVNNPLANDSLESMGYEIETGLNTASLRLRGDGVIEIVQDGVVRASINSSGHFAHGSVTARRVATSVAQNATYAEIITLAQRGCARITVVYATSTASALQKLLLEGVAFASSSGGQTYWRATESTVTSSADNGALSVTANADGTITIAKSAGAGSAGGQISVFVDVM